MTDDCVNAVMCRSAPWLAVTVLGSASVQLHSFYIKCRHMVACDLFLCLTLSVGRGGTQALNLRAAEIALEMQTLEELDRDDLGESFAPLVFL